jgi:hypothetical protein
MALAASGAVIAAAAPTKLAPFRKLRRLAAAEWRRFGMSPPEDGKKMPSDNRHIYSLI